MEIAEAETGVEALITVLRLIAEAREGLREEDVQTEFRTLEEFGTLLKWGCCSVPL